MLKRKKVLFIGLVWPEPTSSAAGYRILQLIDFFQNQDCEVHFASSASWTMYSYPLSESEVSTHEIQLNHSSFDDFIAGLNPEIVVFDRFVSEEQFGWRVREQCPDALTILDTEDLHFVRKAREKAFKKKADINFFTEDAVRELASIYRCDLSLIISLEEMRILEAVFSVPHTLLFYIPFLYDVSNRDQGLPDFEERKDFMFVGNMWHEPNYQTVLQLKKIWPEIRRKIPKAVLHIYGAYMSEKTVQLHQPKDGFLVCGRCEHVIETMKKHRVLLAPIPYGAGIKGKFFDGMIAGLPNVTTPIGAEGMIENEEWNGFIADEDTLLIEQSIELYSNERTWKQKQKAGFDLLGKSFDKEFFYEVFGKKMEVISMNLSNHRNKHFIGKILNHQKMNAAKYMSKWIEEKNK